MIKAVDYIYFNGQAQPGVAWGDYGISSMSVTVGTSKNPTEISLDLVRKDHNFQKVLNKNILSTAPIYSISLGDPRPEFAKVYFGKLALTSYDINKNPESKTASVTFKDRSIVLDKIMVGTLWKHSNGTFPPTDREVNKNDPLNGLGAPKKGSGSIDAVREQFIPVDIPMLCEPCASFSQVMESITRRKKFVCRYIRNSFIMSNAYGNGGFNTANLFGSIAPVDVVRGYIIMPSILPWNKSTRYFGGCKLDGSGYIILGREKPRQGDCEFPATDYNFSELLNAVSECGFKLGGSFSHIKGMGDHFGAHIIRPLADKNPNIRKDWDGTLRSVLDNWCNLHMQSYSLSFDGTTIIGYDLSTETRGRTIETMEKKLQDTSLASYPTILNPGGDGFLVSDVKRQTTLDGCERKQAITRYMKPPRAETFERTLYYYQKVKILQPDDIAGTARHYGRSMDEFYDSIALAKYSPDLREIYLTRNKAWSALGFHMIQKLSPDDPPQPGPPGTPRAAANAGKNLFELAITAAFLANDSPDVTTFNALCDGNGDKVRQNGVQPGPNAGLVYKAYFDVYVGYYSEAEHQRILAFDVEAAGMLGNYCYFPNGVPNSREDCDDYSKRISTFASEPSSDKFRGRRWLPGDLQALLTDEGINPEDVLNNVAANNNIKTLNIGTTPGNSWGTHEKEMEKFLADPVKSPGPIFAEDANDEGVDGKLLVRDQNRTVRRNGLGQPHQLMTLSMYKPIFALANSLYGDIGPAEIELKQYFAGWGQAWYDQIENLQKYDPDRFVSGKSPAVIVVPKAVNDFTFKRLVDSDDKPYIVNTGVFAAQNPDSWLARKGHGTIEKETDPDCEEKTLCERSLSEEICDCRQYATLNEDEFTSNQAIWKITTVSNTAAFNDYRANALSISWSPYYTRYNPDYRKKINIIFPVFNFLTGNISKTIKTTDTRRSILQIYGNYPGFNNDGGNPNNKVVAHDVQWQDVTQEVVPITKPESPGIVSLVDVGTKPGSNPLTTVENLHRQFNAFYAKNQVYPRESISFSLGGTSFGPILREGWLSPASGLQSWNINLGAQGVTQSFSFASRPVALPSREDIISKIETRFAPL